MQQPKCREARHFVILTGESNYGEGGGRLGKKKKEASKGWAKGLQEYFNNGDHFKRNKKLRKQERCFLLLSKLMHLHDQSRSEFAVGYQMQTLQANGIAMEADEIKMQSFVDVSQQRTTHLEEKNGTFRRKEWHI